MNNYKKPLFSFKFPWAKYKNSLITLNNISKWKRFHEPKIKNDLKNMLKEWHIKEPNKSDLKEGLFIVFQVLRHNKRILDADNAGIIIKWSIDAIKEINWELDENGNWLKHIGWIEDDDNIIYTVLPAKYKEGLAETELKVHVFDINLFNELGIENVISQK